ncbi:MAG: 6-bladed beta-propeller [Bacteroidales bacterium]|nr:6-bladed beta-propeller [Bacteroidales bacterium]
MKSFILSITTAFVLHVYMSISMINLLVTGIFSLFVLSACNHVNDSPLCVLDIKEAVDNGESVNLSEYANSVEYIPLESTRESFLNSNSQFYCAGDYLYIFSRSLFNVKDVHVFNNKGKFIKKIGKYGRGPGEIAMFCGLTIENDADPVEICVVGNDKIVIYDNYNNVVKEIPFDKIMKETGTEIKGLLSGFKYVADGKYCLLANAGNGTLRNEVLLTLDSNGRVVSKEEIGKELIIQRNINGRTLSFSKSSDTYVRGGTVFVMTPWRDTVYTIESGVKNIEYVFQFGKRGFGEVASNNNVYMIQSLLETDKFIAHELTFPTHHFPGYYKQNEVVPENSSACLIYDKEKKSYRALKHDSRFVISGFKNDIDNGVPFWPSSVTQGAMYQIISAEDFISMANIASSSKMKEVAATLTKESNPVMVVATLKE